MRWTLLFINLKSRDTKNRNLNLVSIFSSIRYRETSRLIDYNRFKVISFSKKLPFPLVLYTTYEEHKSHKVSFLMTKNYCHKGIDWFKYQEGADETIKMKLIFFLLLFFIIIFVSIEKLCGIQYCRTHVLKRKFKFMFLQCLSWWFYREKLFEWPFSYIHSSKKYFNWMANQRSSNRKFFHSQKNMCVGPFVLFSCSSLIFYFVILWRVWHVVAILFHCFSLSLSFPVKSTIKTKCQ